MADTAPSCVPKSVSNTSGACALAGIEKSARQTSGNTWASREIARLENRLWFTFSVLPRDRFARVDQLPALAPSTPRANQLAVQANSVRLFQWFAPIGRGIAALFPAAQAPGPKRSLTQ